MSKGPVRASSRAGPLLALLLLLFPAPVAAASRQWLLADSGATPVELAQGWALRTLGPEEYGYLWLVVFNESSWRPDAVNPRSGACGLAQAWPCSKLSSVVPGWRTDPLGQLRLFVVPYGLGRYGSFRAAWAYWCTWGRW